MQVNKAIKDILSREYLHRREVDALNTLLTGEISAVEAYNLALEHIRDQNLAPVLLECRNSHALRVTALQDRLEELGEEALESSGGWGFLSRLAEGGAAAISDRAGISMLVAGEDYGFTQYNQQLNKLDEDSFYLAQNDLVPAQARTVDQMNLLAASLS